MTSKTMSYLYHRVPEKMEGSVLYPLNRLKDAYPERYEAELQKYLARPGTLNVKVTPLDCLWNDVLHFTAVPPQEVHEALVSVGKGLQNRVRYFQIDPQSIPIEAATIYLAAHLKPKDLENPENFLPYDPDILETFAHLPKRALEYFQDCVQQNERILIYKFIPHILYRGNLDISDAKIISL